MARKRHPCSTLVLVSEIQIHALASWRVWEHECDSARAASAGAGREGPETVGEDWLFRIGDPAGLAGEGKGRTKGNDGGSMHAAAAFAGNHCGDPNAVQQQQLQLRQAVAVASNTAAVGLGE